MNNTEKIECSVHGMLHGGRAMCGNVIVGCQFCGVKRGECALQVNVAPNKSLRDMTEADFNEAHGG